VFVAASLPPRRGELFTVTLLCTKDNDYTYITPNCTSVSKI
jgi:hypothetical protein